MSYSPELHHPEVSSLGRVLKKTGAWALAGVLVAGGATIAVAYNDLRQGVDGPVFDIQRAETHALDLQPEQSVAADPTMYSADTPLFTIITG